MVFKVIGVMSGTSLDGLDLALCRFEYTNKWIYDIQKCETVSYPSDLHKRLKNSSLQQATEYVKLHKDYGRFIGESINNFIGDTAFDFIASHGHTSIHLPNKNVNFQLGDGAAIAAITKKTTICDFRSMDIALNGQGAPLVPIGDKLLFNNYDTFLNIGGFANASFIKNNSITAYDIVPANYVLNFLCRRINLDFDKDGEVGKSGKCNKLLLEDLEKINYYHSEPPKSLSDHWFFDVFIENIENSKITDTKNILSTVYEHITNRIADEFYKNSSKKVLITGGGALNKYLIELLKQKTNAEIIIPNKKIIEFKEALIFAFMGVLCYLKQPNCLSSVTGAELDNIGGAIYPF